MARPRLSQALVLRVDAVSNALLAVFLLAATWDSLYDFFGLPLAEPPIYAQLLGAALVAFAIVEWKAAETPAQPAVTLAAAVGSAIAAGVLAIWLLVADTGLDTHGEFALWSVAAFLLRRPSSTQSSSVARQNDSHMWHDLAGDRPRDRAGTVVRIQGAALSRPEEVLRIG